MQIFSLRDNLHENSDRVLGGKNKINIINLLSVMYADSVLSVNDDVAVSIFTIVLGHREFSEFKALHCLPFNLVF